MHNRLSAEYPTHLHDIVYKCHKFYFFRSSRSFFFTTLLNVNYGMTHADLEAFANSKVPEPEFKPEDEIIVEKITQ